MAAQPLRELLGVSVVYLGGLNYFFPIRERVPVVSSTGVAVGSLDVAISPFIEASLRRRQSQSGVSIPVFKPYMVADHDREEQQVYEFMDRPLQFVVELGRIEGLRTRRHSHVFARYSFFREALSQTLLIPVNRSTSDSSGDGGNECVANTTSVGATAVVDAQFRHVVDVSDAFVKFIASSSLTIEIFGVNPPT